MTITLGENGSANQLRSNLASTASTALGDALVGVKQPYTGSVARTQHQKNAESISVLDFGADPTGGAGTDSTAAFDMAVSAVGAGGTIIVPPGTYRLKDWTPKWPINIIAAGMDATTFKAAVGATYIMVVSGLFYAKFSNFTLDGSSNTYSGVNVIGGNNVVTGTNTTQGLFFENVKFYRCITGVTCSPASPDQTDKGMWLRCWWVECTTGFWCNTPNSQAQNIQSGSFDYCTTAIRLTGGGVCFTAGQVQGGTTAFLIDNPNTNSLTLNQVLTEATQYDIYSPSAGGWPSACGVFVNSCTLQALTSCVTMNTSSARIVVISSILGQFNILGNDCILTDIESTIGAFTISGLAFHRCSITAGAIKMYYNGVLQSTFGQQRIVVPPSFVNMTALGSSFSIPPCTSTPNNTSNGDIWTDGTTYQPR